MSFLRPGVDLDTRFRIIQMLEAAFQTWEGGLTVELIRKPSSGGTRTRGSDEGT